MKTDEDIYIMKNIKNYKLHNVDGAHLLIGIIYSKRAIQKNIFSVALTKH